MHSASHAVTSLWTWAGQLLLALAGCAAVVLAVVRGSRWAARLRGGRREEPAPVANLRAGEPAGGGVDLCLLDTVRLPEDVVLQLLQIGDRVLVLGTYNGGLAALGDFPASSVGCGGAPLREGAAGAAKTYEAARRRHGLAPGLGKPGASTSAAGAAGSAGSALTRADARDERSWRRQREALIRTLQGEE